MVHELTIVDSGAATEHQAFDDEIHVMAQTELGAFEDNGYPDRIEGTILQVPDSLLRRMSSGKPVFVDVTGQIYRFDRLDKDGTFELRKRIEPAWSESTREPVTLPDPEEELPP